VQRKGGKNTKEIYVQRMSSINYWFKKVEKPKERDTKRGQISSKINRSIENDDDVGV